MSSSAISLVTVIACTPMELTHPSTAPAYTSNRPLSEFHHIAPSLGTMALRCTVVPNGLMGIETLKKEQFHIIISDLRMPQINGLEFKFLLNKMEN